MHTRFRRGAALGGLVLLLGACETETASGITEEQFVEAIVALRRAAAEDTTDFATRRSAVLEAVGVTEAELRAFVDRTVREDPRRLAEAWDEAADRLRAQEAEEDQEEESP